MVAHSRRLALATPAASLQARNGFQLGRPSPRPACQIAAARLACMCTLCGCARAWREGKDAAGPRHVGKKSTFDLDLASTLCPLSTLLIKIIKLQMPPTTKPPVTPHSFFLSIAVPATPALSQLNPAAQSAQPWQRRIPTQTLYFSPTADPLGASAPTLTPAPEPA